MVKLETLIREVPDFPKPGILFKDITPLLADARGFSEAIRRLAEQCPADAVKIVGIEARGFILASALAGTLNRGFVPVRKAGKLPARTVAADCSLEYGTDRLEMHVDGIGPGERVVLVDDVLATGGTAQAACRLIEQCGGVVERILFLIELTGLAGIRKLAGYSVSSLLRM